MYFEGNTNRIPIDWIWELRKGEKENEREGITLEKFVSWKIWCCKIHIKFILLWINNHIPNVLYLKDILTFLSVTDSQTLKISCTKNIELCYLPVGLITLSLWNVSVSSKVSALKAVLSNISIAWFQLPFVYSMHGIYIQHFCFNIWGLYFIYSL